MFDGISEYFVTSAYWLQSGPDLVPITPVDCLSYDCVAIVTLIGDQGVVGHGVEHHATKGWVDWYWARHG